MFPSRNIPYSFLIYHTPLMARTILLLAFVLWSVHGMWKQALRDPTLTNQSPVGLTPTVPSLLFTVNATCAGRLVGPMDGVLYSSCSHLSAFNATDGSLLKR